MAPVQLPSKSGIFVFRLGPGLIAGFMFCVLIGLGSWQVQRLQWKEALISKIDARLHAAPIDVAVLSDPEVEIPQDTDVDYLPATASGVFLNEKELYVYALSTQGASGYDVLTPLRLKDGRFLLVDRGWIPYAVKPTGGFDRMSGEVTIKGLLRVPQHFWGQPDNHPEKNEWYGVDLAAMATADKIDGFLPYVLETDAIPNSDALPIGGQMQVTLSNNHLQYALTWYGLAAILLLIYLTSCYRKNGAN